MKFYRFAIRDEGIGASYIKVLDALLAEAKKKKLIDDYMEEDE